MIDSRNKISFYTSFDPKNYGDQYKTWRKYSHEIYTLQDPKDTKINADCSVLLNNSTDFHEKKLHKITDITKIARLLEGIEKFVIINSDVELYFSNEKWKKICETANDSIVVGCDHESSDSCFVVLNKKIKIPTYSPFLFGIQDWSWWFIELCIDQKIPVCSIKNKKEIVRHKNKNLDDFFLKCRFSKRQDLENYITDLV